MTRKATDDVSCPLHSAQVDATKQFVPVPVLGSAGRAVVHVRRDRAVVCILAFSSCDAMFISCSIVANALFARASSCL